MSSRSANAPIKGYFYQFDHSIVHLLSAQSPDSSVVIEGIEDVDIENDDKSTLVQCKYYEGSEYNHSLIKDALIHMLRHFHATGCREDQKYRYCIYGHYKSGTHKLPQAFDLDFLKKNFLTYKKKKNTHEVHNEIGVTNHQLTRFKALLDINVRALSYVDQQTKIRDLLVSQISGCQADDADAFYYPSAINVVQRIAIKADEKDRKITKGEFLEAVNRKDVVFSLWLRQKFGDAYYARSIKRKYFTFPYTKVPSATRIFAMELTGEFDLSKAVSLLAKLGMRFSHVEHKRTPVQDRFCPYVLLRNIAPADLVSLKAIMLQQGVKFADGHPFNGSAFHPAVLAGIPTKENQIQIKFISNPEQIKPLVAAIAGSVVEIFDFFKSSPLEDSHIPYGVQRHKIKVYDTHFNLISEVL